ncbi:MAG: hypothetical protein QG570_253 [Patescibacteria group bacterium]|nr:hypothetical protein [Patescibacteria group bacterium]
MNKKILVLEDDKDISLLLTDLLSAEGYEVRISDSEEFLKWDDFNPNVILLDYWLNGVDGKILYEKIRRHSNFKSSSTILLSAVNNILEIASELGVDYIKKPFDIDELLKKIASI